MTLALVPFPVDLPASLTLAEAALRTRLAPGEKLEDFLPQTSTGIRAGRVNGGLFRTDGVTRGIVTWEPSGPLGVALRLFYLDSPSADPEDYRHALDATERVAGPIAFAAGPLGGLSEEQEGTVMRGQGFAPFGRWEMAFPSTARLPSVPLFPGVEVRPVDPSDEPMLARLHERAYENHLDRFIAMEDLDPVRDADRQLRDYFTGRYGELLSPGSSVATRDGRVVAAAIATRREAHVLIIDVMSEPAQQGSGLGRAALTEAVRALRDRGETAIVLNVTDGNERAMRLYSHLGFVRTMGPTREWYDARRMRVEFPVPPSR